MPRFLSSLRVRLLLLVLVTALPGVGLILHEGLEQWELATNISAEHALDHAREISREHERLIQAGRHLLQALTEITSVRAHDGESCNRLFSKMVKAHPAFTNLGAAKPNGDVFCSAIPLTQPANFADQPHFQQALRTGDFAVGEYLVDSISGKPNIAIAYPAVDSSGVAQSVVIAGLSLDWFNKFAAELRLPQGSAATLTDHKGMILARYPEPEKWIGKLAADTPIFKATLTHQGEGVAEAAGVDGTRRLYGFTKLSSMGPGRDIYIRVGIPEKIAFSEVREAFHRDLTLIGIVLALSLAGVWLGAGYFITRPVEELVGATKRLAAGDLSARTRLPAGESDLNQLARSFDQMADSLEQHITERKRAEEEVRRNLERIQALREIDRAITSTLDLDAILNVLLEKVDNFLRYPAAAIVRLLNQRTGEWEFFTSRNLDKDECKALDARLQGGRAKVVFETQQCLMVHNVQTDPLNQEPEFFRKHSLVSYLGIPLTAKGQPLGVISLYALEERQFSEEEIDLLSTLAGQAAIAIENSQLYEQTKKQAEEMKKAVAQMEIANKIKDEFLSVMSHELRTPLNVVLGYTAMLRDGMLGEIPPKQKELLNKVIRRAGDLLSIIRDILQATQIESRAVVIDSHLVRLGDFLDRLKAGHDQPLDKELTLKWDYPADLPPAIIDSEKLEQILQNLIHNAVKFTENGHVKISARVIKEAISDQPSAISHQPTQNSKLTTQNFQQFVELKVADTGIGIPKESLPIIFDKFHQADSSETRLHGGVGLGLYIAKKFTEMLGGTIQVESELGKGSTFTVTLPLEQ